MQVCQLEIENFRGVRKGRLIFPEHGVIFGPNNVGKSTIIDALALLFERERIARQISDWDFCGGSPKPESRIVIIGTITDFDEDGKDQPEQFPRWFSADAARVVWWDPNKCCVNNELDRPPGAKLAAQVALSIRYEEDTCEFEARRYFYNGPCDPFTDDCNRVPAERLLELGLFVLPSSRQWDKLLAFGSSSFMKVLKGAGAIPGESIESLKNELRSPHTQVEDSADLKLVLERAQQELHLFLMLEASSSLVYRPTMLDALSVLQSLMPHIRNKDGSLLPFARSGAGAVSLQAFLIVLAFAEQRKKVGKNFILAAEEPELHLHPSLHRRLANQIRNISGQSIVTTHSPLIASGFQAAHALYAKNDAGVLTCQPVEGPSVGQLPNNVAKLYRQHREQLYDALMGCNVLIPEGATDWRWIRNLQTVLEASIESSEDLPVFTVIPTQDAAVARTFSELKRFRADMLPLVDGDKTGDQYVDQLTSLAHPPNRIAQLGKGAGMECLIAYIAEPLLDTPGAAMQGLLASMTNKSVKELRRALVDRKKDFDLAEHLSWEAAENARCLERIKAFFKDLGDVSRGQVPQRWTSDKRGTSQVFIAQHITAS